jgi:hypothetical protein
MKSDIFLFIFVNKFILILKSISEKPFLFHKQSILFNKKKTETKIMTSYDRN